jgi:SAM-dependent methyltransferase
MIVEQEHLKYLHVQRGEVSDALKSGVDAWKAAYARSLDAIYESMAPALPTRCRRVLDVGSGLGGIDVLLARRYPNLDVHTLDGVEDPPVVASHSKPFSHAGVAADFLRKNGVTSHTHHAPYTQSFDVKFDLVISFAAWGFHITPGDYLPQVKAALAPKAVIILDVRHTRRDWLEDFVRELGKPEVLDRGKKHVRLAWTT